MDCFLGGLVCCWEYLQFWLPQLELWLWLYSCWHWCFLPLYYAGAPLSKNRRKSDGFCVYLWHFSAGASFCELVNFAKVFSSSILLAAFSIKLSPNRVALFLPLPSPSREISLITGFSQDQAICLHSCVMEFERFATKKRTLRTRRILLILASVSSRSAHRQVKGPVRFST